MPDKLRMGPFSGWFVVCTGLFLTWCGLVFAPGLHENDWPLLMWLARAASWADPSPLVIGHYGILQLVLVRILGPVLGNTLVAAKVLNILAALLSCLIVGLIAQTLTGTTRSRLVAMVAAATSVEYLLTAQSEFAEPLPTGLFLVALYLLLPISNAVDRRIAAASRFLVAGFCFGCTGLFRIHFQVFALISIIIYAMAFSITAHPNKRWRYNVQFSRAHLQQVNTLCFGFLLGISPSVYLNLRVHGTLSSPIAHTFVGQVLYGYDDYNLFETYALHPLSEIIHNHPTAYVHLILRRMQQFPQPLVAIGIGTIILVWARSINKLAKQFGLFLLVICAAYSVLFLWQSWVITLRLRYPLVLILSIVAGVVLEVLVAALRLRWVILAGVLFLAAYVPYVYDEITKKLMSVRTDWRHSEQLCAVLRHAGMQNTREAFVFAWNRVAVDDPELVGYYNFGFWNLLNERYRRERPNPYHELVSLERFARFMEGNDVKFIVVTCGNERPFPVLKTLIASGTHCFGKYRFLEQLHDDFIFVYQN